MITDNEGENGARVLEVRAETIPEELKARPQWVNWRAVEKDNGKLDKHPYNPRTGRRASTTDLLTWSTFETVIEALGDYDGIGFVFCSGDPYTGIDLDGCVDISAGDSKKVAVASWAMEIVRELDAYTEVTPSGTGLHIIVQGDLPGSGRNGGAIEMYDMKRFFIMTGRVLGGGRQ